MHYYDRTDPVQLRLADEIVVDLSQSLDRPREGFSLMPAITPKSRLWRRRQCEWLLAPECLRAQGFEPRLVRHVRDFSHRQIVDLAGNSFNATCEMVALAAGLAHVEWQSP